MTRTRLDSEDALEQATLALFRQMGWGTVNCMDEVFGDTLAAPRRPNLGREMISRRIRGILDTCKRPS